MKAQELILNMIVASRIVCRTRTGEVFKIKKNGKKEKFKIYPNGNGYDAISVYWKGYKRTVMFHQVVYLCAYLKTYNGREKCIDHIDGNKYNNSIQNLRLVTYKQNANNKKKFKRLKKSEKEKIHAMKKEGFNISMIAEVFGVTHNTIRYTLNNKHKRK